MKKKRMAQLGMQNFKLQEIWRMMKLSAFLLFTGMHVVMADAVGQVKITINVGKVTYLELFDQIRKQTGYTVVYSNNELDNKQTVDVGFQQWELKAVMDKILANTGLTYEMMDEFVVLKTLAKEEEKTVTIQGKVTDQAGLPLPGVAVIVKGTSLGTVTDHEGNYKLTVLASVGEFALVFSFMGMETQEIRYIGKTKVDVTLKEDKKELDEVVVTGYQTISKERSTGSFAKVSARKMEMRRRDNLSSVLEGQIAGYSDGMIRGISTMNAQKTPLYVIDGFPVENTTIDASGSVMENAPVLNMEDIESITVLKDASAASIYGARAANGVIVITTKKAKQGKTQIQLSGVLTVQPYAYYTGHLTNSADIIDIEKQWAAQNPELNNGLDRALAEADNRRHNYASPSAGVEVLLDLYTNKISQAEADQQLAQLAKSGYRYYKDIERYAKRNSFYQQYNLSVGKATERNNFILSASYRNNKTEDKYTKDNQIGINIQNTLQVTSWLKADVGMYINYKNATEQTYDLLSSYGAGFNASPYDRLKDDQGNPTTMPSQYNKIVRDNIQNYGLYNVDITPLSELNKRLSKMKEFINRTFAKLEVKLLPGLTYNAMFQYEYGVSRVKRLEEMDSYATRALINKFATLDNAGEVVYHLPTGDIFYMQNHFSNAYNFRQQLNLDKTWNGVHGIVWIAGQEVRNTKLEYDHNTHYGYDDDLLSSQYIDEPLLTSGFAGLMNTWASISERSAQKEMVNRFVSFYSNFAYTYDNRYTLSGSIRWDRSNLWGTNSKYQNKPLWSVGANWNINRENFFGSTWVDLLKLRASYGIGGNIAKDAAPYLTASYETSSLVGGLSGTIFSPPNPDLRWEKTTTVNVGVDFSLFSNRLSGSIDVYNKKSVDLLANQNGVPTEGFGYSTLTFNNGAMRNRGFELTLQGDLFRESSAFHWNMGFLLGYNKNKVTKINVTAPVYYLQLDHPQAFPVKGNPYNAIYAYKWAGLNNTGEPQIYDKNGQVTTTDYMDLGAIHYVGTSVPVYSGSFTNVWNYKNLELSVQMLFAGGHKIKNTNIPQINMGTAYSSGLVPMTNKDIRYRWRQAGDEKSTDVPRLLFTYSPDFNYDRESIYNGADVHVLDASYIRINNVALSYRMPEDWAKKAGFGGVRLQFNIENLATIAFDSKAGYLLGNKIKPNYVCGLYLDF